MDEERTKALSDELMTGARKIFESNRLGQYLRAASLFRGYSPRNAALIFFQKPDATYVAGYDEWKKLGRYVRRGETGITIFAPAMVSTEVSRPVFDDDGNPVPDEKGSPQTETAVRTKIQFHTAAVFDILQTDGDPIPALCGQKKNAAPDYQSVFRAVQKACPYRILFGSLPGEEAGHCCREERKIVLRTGMEDREIIETLLRGCVTAMMPHHAGTGREQERLEEEGAAFLLSDFFGADTSGYRFDSVSVWSHGMDSGQLWEMLENIQGSANEIIFRIDAAMKSVEKVQARKPEKLKNRLEKAAALSEKLSAGKEVIRNGKLPVQ